MHQIDFLFQNRLYLASFNLKLIHPSEYLTMFDRFKQIILQNTSKDEHSQQQQEHIQRMGLLLTKLNEFLVALIEQKNSKLFFYWQKGDFIIDFLLKQRDFGLIINTLKILFKFLKNRFKVSESIRIFFGDKFKKLLSFLFAINLGPILGQFGSFNGFFLQNPSMENGTIGGDI